VNIPTEMIVRVLNRYLQTADRVTWSRFDEFDWDSLAESEEVARLTVAELSAVRTSLLVEDHIPGYVTEYFRFFRVDESVSPEVAWRNRQILHFVFNWGAEEDRHAHVLELYLRSSGHVEDPSLTAEMVHEGTKPFQSPHDEASLIFTYAMLQEKATQLFYQKLYSAVEHAPILRRVLRRLFQDEARHCSFFSELVLMDLQHNGLRIIPRLREAVDAFQMPLAGMLENYKRQAIAMRRAAKGYDHREAFSQLDAVIHRYAYAASNSKSSPVEDLYTAVRNIAPTGEETL